MGTSVDRSRRRFLRSAAGLAATAAVGQRGWPAAAATTAGRIPIGLQLYSVRGAFARDVPGTLKAVAEMGYQGVEFWGYSGTPEVFQQYTAAALRGQLDGNGLACCGIHCQLQALADDCLQRTVANSQILGNQYLIVAGAKDQMESEPAIKAFAEFLTATAARCKAAGMRVGYHAHGFDFAKIGGRWAWDILFSAASPEVIMQMDVGNCLGGGGDAVAMLTKFAGRCATIHLKEHQDKTFDSSYYQEVFRLCDTSAGTEWWIVEMGDSGGNGLAVPRRALHALRAVGH